MNANKKLIMKNKIDPVEVYCRCRPLFDNENEKCLKIIDENNLMLQMPECSAAYRSGQTKQLVYSFSKIFDETVDQKKLFDEVGYPLVKDLIHGKNGLLFTYGVTGSGKTHTMIGNQQQPGLLQRSLDTIFNNISSKQSKRCTFKSDKMNSYEIQNVDAAILERQRREFAFKTPSAPRTRAHTDVEKLTNDSNGVKTIEIIDGHLYAVFISCVEIYNNYIYDLLDDVSNLDAIRRNDNKESKSLKEDSNGMMYIKDMIEVEVKSTEEALELMHRAQKRRVVAYTDLNSESSRSHSIFTIRLVQAAIDVDTNLKLSKNAIHVSQLSLVDLAGSERTKRTKNTGSRLKEAGNINSSLMALRNCIETLRENILSGTKKMVPYRDSKLTLLFKNYFEGNGKIKMILCINPSAQEFDETINVLKFSDLVKDVLVPVINDNRNLKALQSLHSDFELANSIISQHSGLSVSKSIPSLDLSSPDDEIGITKLITFLEEYSMKRDAIVLETNALNQQLYIRLREIYDENERIKEENSQLKHRLEIKEKNENRLENKIKALEKLINVQTPILSKENIKPILNTDTIERKRFKEMEPPSTPTIQTPTVSSTRSTKVSYTIGKLSSNIPSLPTPLSAQRIAAYNNNHNTSSTITPYNRYNQSPMTRCPPPLPPSSALKQAGIPVANRRAQRRSRSTDNWLDHRPDHTTKTDTVLQPKMQRKKSVSKIELSDAKKSTKYVLTHQQQDEEGEIVTNLIKGDVIQSPCGGANIIFTDVETLRVQTQDIPKPSRKRPSEDVICDHLAIEERCSIAIEGHSSARKMAR